MKKQKPQTEALRKLREQAEALAQTKREDIPNLSPEEIRRVVHDLHTHQIELEIQNEQLRATQVELQGSQERLTDLYDFAPVGYITVSEDGSILEANLTAAQMLNRDRALLLSRPFSAFIVDDDQDVYFLHRRALAQDENRQTCELRVCRKGGDPFWVGLESTRQANVDGARFAIRHAFNDITTRRKTDARLWESEQRYHDIAETISDWVWEMDADLRYSYFSPSYEQHSGVHIEDAIGRTREELYADILPNLEADDFKQWEKFNHLIKARKTFRDCGTKWFGSNGKMQYFSTSGRPVYTQDGEFLGYRGVGTNITERKLADEEREFLIGELEAKNTELERFVYTISHELKSPLVTIAGFSGILLDDLSVGDDKKLKDHVQHITTAVDTMSVMLDDLLELSRIGRIIHTREVVALVDLAHEVVNSIKSQAVKLDVTIEIASDLPVVYGDRTRLGEALQNMIVNAIKFCAGQPEPHVKIGSRKQAMETVCYVQDNGKGIDPKYHEKIFALFERLDPTVKGTGIGLTLVHRILEEHGGKIWVESEGVGKGSCFCFTIPQREDQ